MYHLCAHQRIIVPVMPGHVGSTDKKEALAIWVKPKCECDDQADLAGLGTRPERTRHDTVVSGLSVKRFLYIVLVSQLWSIEGIPRGHAVRVWK